VTGSERACQDLTLIIQIGSDVTERGLPGSSAYAAAKAAQLAVTPPSARELGPFGITVNLVAPGWIPVSGTPESPREAAQLHRGGASRPHGNTRGHRRSRGIHHTELYWSTQPRSDQGACDAAGCAG
jgi:NAD(P)-dependent dehydrogenase (short-subunit alcohol dehydrogenase family)